MKRIFTWLIIISMVIGLCACGTKSPTWQEQYDLGVRYLSEGNYEEAIIAFTVAIEIDPKQASTYVGRGNAYIGSGETEENLAAAQADYEQAIELDEICVEAYLGLADVYARRGDYDQSLEILQKGLEKTSGNQSIEDRLTEIKNEAASNRTYGVYIAPELDVAQVDLHLRIEYEYDEFNGYNLCAYAIRDEETHDIVMTFSIPADNHPDYGFYKQENITLIAQTNRYLVAEIWLGAGDVITLSYDKLKNELKELTSGDYFFGEENFYVGQGIYASLNENLLIGTSMRFSFEDLSFLSIYTMDGTLVDELIEGASGVHYDVVGDMLYYSFTDEMLYFENDYVAEHQVWSYDSASGHRELLYVLNCYDVVECGDSFVSYKMGYGGDVLTDYF